MKTIRYLELKDCIMKSCFYGLFRLETVTMVRYDLSKVVTDQKHDEQFFHEGSHV